MKDLNFLTQPIEALDEQLKRMGITDDLEDVLLDLEADADAEVCYVVGYLYGVAAALDVTIVELFEAWADDHDRARNLGGSEETGRIPNRGDGQ